MGLIGVSGQGDMEVGASWGVLHGSGATFGMAVKNLLLRCSLPVPDGAVPQVT